MALLDTLKKGLSTAVSYATAPITAPFKAAKSSFDSTVDLARKAASMAPTNDPNKLFSSTGGSNSLKNDTVFTVPQGGGVQTVTKSPTPTLQQTNPVTPKGDIGVPQIGSNSVAPKAVTVPNPIAPKPVAPASPATPAVNTQISGSNPFGNSNYTPTFSNPTPTTPTPTQGPEVPTTGYVNAPPPTPETLNGNTGSQLSELEKAILGTYQQSDAERQAQDALVKLAQQQADLSGAYRAGTNKIGEQPIVLDLLRGQQQALQKQYEGQVGALADQSKPLEVQLANLQAQRELQNKALSTQYGFASEAQKRQDAIDQAKATGNKPIEVGGSLVQLNPQTGQYEVIYQSPAKADDNGFTLSEGQIRYDANGNFIASGGAKSDTAGTPSSYKEWQLAGSPGTYLDYLKGGATGGNKMTAGQAETLAEASNLKSNVLGPLYSLIQNQGNLFGPIAGRVGGANPYDTNSQAAQANFNNAAQLVGSFLEGGKLAEGDIGRYRSMLPQLTDTPAVAQQKLDAVAKLIESKQQEYLTSYGQAGFNTSGYQGSQMDDNAKKSALSQKGVSQALIDSWVASGHSLDDLAREKGVTFTNASNSALNSSIGSLSAKYESGGNPGAIGYDSTGGYSYGTYQLAHNNAQKFVQESPYAREFSGIPFNSAQFQKKWKEIAQKDPQGFASAQHDYIAKTHLEPIVNRLKSQGMDVSRMSPVVQDVIWSTAVQHGPGNKIIEQALATAKDEQDFIKKVYQLRWNNGAGFASSTPAVKQSVYNRFFGANGELAQALARSTA